MVQFTKYLLDFQDYFFEKNSSGNSSCPSSPATWCTNSSSTDELCIQNPTLIPTCLLALVIGIFCSKRICQLTGKFPTRWLYHTAFFLFGIMMTSAGILHCFLGNPQQVSTTLENTEEDSMLFAQLLVTVIDVGLTSNIAVTFLFCGLCDIQFLNPKSSGTRCLLFISYFIVFFLWTFGLFYQWKWITDVLYFGIISISCLVYLITQLCIKSNHRALPALFVGGIYGAIGILAASFGAEHICKSEGLFWSQYIGPEFIWFLFSDISMAFVFIYVIRANQEKKLMIRKYDIDIEKHPEKY